MSDHPAGRALTADDLPQLAQLLAGYAAHDRDQLEYWRVESPRGRVYIDISRQPRPGSWETIWPLPPNP